MNELGTDAIVEPELIGVPDPQIDRSAPTLAPTASPVSFPASEPQIEVRTKRKYKKRRKVKRRKKRVAAVQGTESAVKVECQPCFVGRDLHTPPAPPEEPVAVPPPNGWVQHADVHMPIMEAEIAWAVEDMFGIPRGLVSKEFVDAARATVKRHYPEFRRSLLHDLLTQGKNSRCGMFVAVPDWAKKRVDRAVRLCDLMETMVVDDPLS